MPNNGLTIHGEYLNTLSCVDEIVLFEKDKEKLTATLEELHQEAAKVSLKMHSTKAQFMTNTSRAQNGEIWLIAPNRRRKSIISQNLDLEKYEIEQAKSER